MVQNVSAPRPLRRRRSLAIAVALTLPLGALGLAACGDDEPSGGTTTEVTTEVTATTVTAPSDSPEIVAFDVPDTVTCPAGASDAPVDVSWEVANVDAVELTIDGQPPGASAGYTGTGTASLPVPCDGESHEIGISATNDSGITVDRSTTVDPG